MGSDRGPRAGGERELSITRSPELAAYHGDEETGSLAADSLSLSLGPLVVRFRAASESCAVEVHGPRVAFLSGSDTRPDVDVVCSYGPTDPGAGRAAFVAEGGWQARRLDHGREEICFWPDPATQAAPWCRLRHDAAIGAAELVVAPRERSDVIAVGFPVDEYVVARRLAREDGVVLHASALLWNGGAYLFVGHSGAGKSTTALNAMTLGAMVLSDDRTIVTLGADGAATAWGSPWHGSLRRAHNASAPVRGIFVLSHADADSVSALAAREAVGEIFVRVILPSPDPRDVERAFDTVHALARRVPTAALRQRPTSDGFRLATSFAGET